jgi:glycosyltransferase involved in cell wall biosynthesis
LKSPTLSISPARKEGGLKLVVQIPAFNEAATLARTIADVPRQLPGVAKVEVLVIDDGSSDQTGSVAAGSGADRVVRFPANRGLAMAFQKGLEESLDMGADIVVNFDGDNQYPGSYIPQLIAPIVEGRADIVLGERDFDSIPHFSAAKKFLQRFGSAVVSRLSGVACRDATTGFRAFSREAAQGLYVAGMFTYTLETLFLAGARKLHVQAIRITTNPRTRDSRLFKSSFEYVLRSIGTIVRTSMRYRATAVASWLSFPLFLVGLAVIARFFLYHFVLEPEGTGHVQSLVLAGVLITVGVILVGLGLVADGIATNRRLLEEILTKIRKRD